LLQHRHGCVVAPATNDALAGEAKGDVMKRITLIAGALALVAGVAAADAQGIGYPPGVNPSNPQDLTYRSNPQDLLVPGGNNPQDLVRPSPNINGPRPNFGRSASVPTSRSETSALQYAVKTKPKKKTYHRRSTAQR
jgi:hypothetical protein